MALTTDIPSTRFGVPGDGHQPISRPLAASAVVYGGSVAVTYQGYLVAPSTPSSDQLVVGMNTRKYDNTGGAAGDVVANIETGSFFLFGGTAGDALTQADVGQKVYLIDEKTVGKTNGSSSRPEAGTLRFIDPNRAGGDKYAVTLGTPASGNAVTP